MNFQKTLSTIFVQTMLLCQLAQSQDLNREDIWQSFGPGENYATIEKILADPKLPRHIFAESFGSLFQSTDAGTIWQRVETPHGSRLIHIKAIQGKIFIATQNGGLFSSDIGPNLEWQSTGALLSDKTISFLFEYGDRIFAGTLANGVFFSDDRGENWTQASTPMADERVETMVVINSVLFMMTNFGEKLFRSVDSGSNWQAVTHPADGELLAAANGILYIGNAARDIDKRGIWRSTDLGESWSLVRDLGPSNIFQGLAAAGNRLFMWAHRDPFDSMGGVQRFFTSADNGETWTTGELQFVTDMILHNGILVAATARNGIYLSFDSGANWVSANTPFDAATGNGIADLQAVGNTLYASVRKIKFRDIGGPFWLSDGVYISTDNGRNWKRAAEGLSEQVAILDIESDLNYMLALGSEQLFRSTDFGRNWQVQNNEEFLQDFNRYGSFQLYKANGSVFLTSIPTRMLYYSLSTGEAWTEATNSNFFFTLFAADGALYGGSFSDVFKSMDGGISWQILNAPINSEVISLLSSNGILMAGTNSEGIFLSTDAGQSWTPANAPLNTGTVSLLCEASSRIVATTSAGLHYSDDLGRNWTPTTAPNISISAFLYANNRLFAAGQGTSFSDDGGISWQQADEPFRSKQVTRILQIADRIYAGTTDGIYWTEISAGKKWFTLNTGLQNQYIYDLNYLPVQSRFFAATNQGVYSQKLDTQAPVVQAFILAGGRRFTASDSVGLVFAVQGADSMQIAENPDFPFASWQNYDAFLQQKLLPGDGLKTIYAKFKDISSNESMPISAQITLDQTNPNFAPFPHTPPQNAAPNTLVTINQQVDESNLESMTLRFRRVGESFNNSSRAVPFVDGSAIIDSVWLRNKGLDYQIIATDQAGRSTTQQNSTLDFFSLPVNIAALGLGNSRSLPGGTGGTAYRIVSIPMELQNSAHVKNIFSGLGKYGRRGDWRAWAYDGDNDWEDDEDFILQTGAAVFMLRRNGGSLSNAGAGFTTKTSDGVLGNIPGWQLRGNAWTLIGNPYNTRIALTQLMLKSDSTRLSDHGAGVQVWGYDGRWRNPQTDADLSLEPWSGLFVRAPQADAIVFADSKEPYVQPVAKSHSHFLDADLQAAENEWRVQIIATAGEFSDDLNFFGVRKDADERLDNHDWYEPPFLPGGIGLSFPHEDWNDPAELTVDFRPASGDGQSWRIAVTGAPGRAVQLSFVGLESLPETTHLLFIDESTKIARDLRKESVFAVRIPNDAASKRLTVLAGEDFFIQQNAIGLLTAPTDFALEQNYPNPFNPATTIRYALPVAGQVSLKIYDVLGTQILVLQDRTPREAGYYEQVADLSRLGSGVYFYRISVEGEERYQSTRKMLLVK